VTTGTNKAHLLRTTLFAALSASPALMGAAFAQVADRPQVAAVTERDVIVVTGSRLASDDLVANSPIATVTAETIQDSGILALEQVLNTLPQVVPGFSATSNNPADGTSTVDLRGLGPQRTLVLVNGKRIAPATKAFAATDLNAIPSRLIERIEVVSGGASAVYGSDALAGVVNFILKRDFEGLEFGTQYGITEIGDGEQFDASVLMGTNFADGKGNITGFLSFYDRDFILPSEDREWSLVSNAGGSATGRARFDNQPGVNPFTPLPVSANCPGGGASANLAFNDNGTVRGFCNDLDLGPNSDRYDFTPVNYLQSPAERLTAAILGRYEISDDLEFTLEAYFADNRNQSQLAETPATPVLVPINNVFLTPEARAALAGRPDPNAPGILRRRMIELGPRQQQHDNNLTQISTGLNWDIGGDWKLESYFSYGRTEFNDSIFNDVSRSKVAASLAATSTTSCGAALLAIFRDCVPINYFGQGTITQQGVDFIKLNFSDATTFERFIGSAVLSGPLFQLPAGSVDAAFGVERREDYLQYRPDAAHGSGDIFGFNAEKPVQGDFTVDEAFFETQIPVFKSDGLIRYAGLELGARYSDYSTVGGITSYKAGGEMELPADIRLRAMYQKANRAPNVFELFQAGDQGFPPFTDPCSTVNVNNGAARVLSADVRAFCTATMGFDPVTANFVQPNSQIEVFSFGNPDLKEEESDTMTAGVVWQPSYVPGLTATVDWYRIEVADFIGSLAGGPAGIVAACFEVADLNAPECRDERVGPLVFRDATAELKVRVPLANVSALETEGVDVAVNYSLGLDFWRSRPEFMGDTLRFALQLGVVNSFVLDGIDYAGTAGAFNISLTAPEVKGSLQVGYDIGPVSLTYMGQYIGSMDNQGNIPEFDDGGYNTIDSFFYSSLNARWALNDTVELFGGVRNVEDKDPPVFDNSPDGNTDPNTYDVLGRNYYVGARVKY